MPLGAWRAIDTGRNTAAMNMAVDELLLQRASDPGRKPVLRVYGWDPPAVSLGFGQDASRELNLDKCRREGIDIVRRITGGRAVLHWEELTYSVIASEEKLRTADQLCVGVAASERAASSDRHSALFDGISDSFHLIGRCLVQGLREYGIDATLERPNRKPARRLCKEGIETGASIPCFSSISRWEVVCQGRKLIGSAQRRVNGAVLQHGSLLVGDRHLKLLDLTPRAGASGSQRRIRELDAGCIHLGACSEKVDLGRLSESLFQGFAQVLGVEMEHDCLTLGERELAVELSEAKYSDLNWNQPIDTAIEPATSVVDA